MGHASRHVEEDDVLGGGVRGRLDDLGFCRSGEPREDGYTESRGCGSGQEIAAVQFIELVDNVFHGNRWKYAGVGLFDE